MAEVKDADKAPGERTDSVLLASAIITAKGGAWTAKEAVGLVKDIHAELMHGCAAGAGPEKNPAVPIDASRFQDGIICLYCGRKMKLLKRHLKKEYGLTPEQYRGKWGLPADYPMAAPNYSRARSDMAKRIGLGKQKRSQQAA